MALIGNIKGIRGQEWVSQAGDPPVPNGTEIEGDLYLNTLTSDVWEFHTAVGDWEIVANIEGAQGPAGPAGAGGVPIGGVIAWMGAVIGLPVPSGFQSCDGSAITDAESPFLGFSTPALNGTVNTNKRFLRGTSNTATVGNTSGAAQHSHLPGSYMCTSSNPATGGGSGPICGANVQFGPGSGGSPVSDTVDHIPPSVDTQFIMRIK